MQDFFDNIFALADIHGKWQPIRNFYLANKLKYSEWVQSLFNKDIVVFTKLLYEKGDISNCCLPVTKNKESYK